MLNDVDNNIENKLHKGHIGPHSKKKCPFTIKNRL